MVTVDITCDLMDEDESGYVWTFLREARDPRLIEPGAIVVAGDEDAPAVAEVVKSSKSPPGRWFTSAYCRSDRGLRGTRSKGDRAGIDAGATTWLTRSTPLVDLLPAFAAELEHALRANCEHQLTDQVASLAIEFPRGCGDDDFCSSFYTVCTEWRVGWVPPKRHANRPDRHGGP